MFRRSKPQLRKKRESSSEDEADTKKPTLAGNVAKKPAVQKGLQIGAVGTIKSDKKAMSKGLSFDHEGESADFSKPQPTKPKADAAKLSSHTFGKGSEKPAAASKGSYYTNTSYSSDELAALTKNAKSLGAGSIIRLPTSSAGAPSLPLSHPSLPTPLSPQPDVPR